MCTLMQKDVLIELIATAQADLSKRLELPLNDDQIYLSRLRSEIYRSEPDALDFQLLSTLVKQISDKYHSLPLI
ncbi:hypothetical protein ACN9OH_00035 [Glaesserella parasuis]|uniref:Uncharacterized protein n=1 Tax=Glaesserella parasuis TaxID=738 RepID=A0AA42EC81_GLAPU|nr:hypothetical protein [Glaesserella parasuis]MDO9663910.1 hypothetical protein [Glaesserella parasuis]MDP0310352.1 hypothetical protein [Glaesserella parasuis]MDP0329990.1 hypothetical protein [Glaesserella parasuis]MDP0392216.1 hypothetical protein [Glaesserella parasuis]